MEYEEHIQAAEEGAAMALRQEQEFKEFCEAVTLEMMADPETLLMVQLKMSVVQISLAGAQLHATLAVAKRPEVCATA
jgi:hypothetical protein